MLSYVKLLTQPIVSHEQSILPISRSSASTCRTVKCEVRALTTI